MKYGLFVTRTTSRRTHGNAVTAIGLTGVSAGVVLLSATIVRFAISTRHTGDIVAVVVTIAGTAVGGFLLAPQLANWRRAFATRGER